jgi:hypothetical protein
MKKSLLTVVATIVALALAIGCTNPIDANETEKVERFIDPVRAINSSSADAYENDDTQTAAKTIVVTGAIQEHNFYDDATDWYKFTAAAGKTYVVETWVFGYADTIVTVYDGSTSKGSNDDKASGDYGSKVTFKPTVSKTYTIKCASYGSKKGTDRNYNISVTESGTNPPTPITLPQPKKSWTVLVYLDGDNNLSSYATKDIAEMYAVGSDATNLNIIALWDNSSSTHGYYYIESGKATLITDIGEPNMGSPVTAKAFIDWATANFPADKFAWVWWNHGGAVDRAKGVCWDDTNGGDHVTEVEQLDIMNYLVGKIGKKVEFAGFDACLMACAEIFYQYQDVANYVGASEQTEPGDGWDWKYLANVKSNPSCNGGTFGQYVFNGYKAWYASSSDVTFSIANLAYADELGAAIHDFAYAAINSGVAGSTYKSLQTSITDFSGYTKDLAYYMDKVIASTAVPQAVKDKATALKSAIRDYLIIYNWTGSTWTNKAFGCAITMKADTTTYSLLELCKDTSWDEFCTFAGF